MPMALYNIGSRAMKIVHRSDLGRQLVCFILVGGIATALHFTVLVSLKLANVPVLMASGVGFLVGALANYLMNRQFTFRSTEAHSRTAPRFTAAALLGLAFNSALMALFYHVAAMHYLMAQMFATIGTISVTFLVNRMWTFAPRASSGAQA